MASLAPALLTHPLKEFRDHAADSRVGVYETAEAMIEHLPQSGYLGAIINDPLYTAKSGWDVAADGLHGYLVTYDFTGRCPVKDKSLHRNSASEKLMALSAHLAALMRGLTGQDRVFMQSSVPSDNKTPHYDTGPDALRFNVVVPFDTGASCIPGGTAWIADHDLTQRQIDLLKQGCSPESLGLTAGQAPSDRPFFLRRGISAQSSHSDMTLRHDALMHWSTGWRYALVAS